MYVILAVRIVQNSCINPNILKSYFYASHVNYRLYFIFIFLDMGFDYFIILSMHVTTFSLKYIIIMFFEHVEAWSLTQCI